MKKVICGFECELDFSEEWSDCYVVKNGCSGSLQFLEQYGFLESYRSGSDYQLEVPVSIIDKIRKWADANGY